MANTRKIEPLPEVLYFIKQNEQDQKLEGYLKKSIQIIQNQQNTENHIK